jgi:hypothetical protein
LPHHLSGQDLNLLVFAFAGWHPPCPLAPAKVLRSDAAIPTRRRSSRASRAAASTATAESEGSRGAAAAAGPQQAVATTEPRQSVAAAEAQQAATAAEPQQAVTAAEPQQAATTAMAVAVSSTPPAPAAAGSPRAAVVEVPDDDGVLPLGWDQWASPPASAPEPPTGALVVRGDVGAALGCPADGAGTSSSRAGPATRPEQEREHAGALPAHFVDAHAE